jgi:hypothetical protein
MAPYRSPRLFADLNLLDLLELSGSGVRAAPLLNLSQPTVSRRQRKLQQDLGLRESTTLRQGDSACLRLLRRAAKRHRLEAGVWRMGGDGWCFDPGIGHEQVLPVPPRFAALQDWHALVEAHVLDGAVVSGYELRLAMPTLSPQQMHPVRWQSCIAVPLLQIPLLVLGTAERQFSGLPHAAVRAWSTVLMPPLHTCGGLAMALRQQQLRPVHLSPEQHGCRPWLAALNNVAELALATPLWHHQLQGCSPVPLTLQPLPRPLTLDLWLLVHCRDWCKHPELEEWAGSWATLVNSCIAGA